MSKLIPLALVTLAVTALAPSASLARPTAGPQIVVSARNAALHVTGTSGLQDGYVRLVIRNESRGEHGIELVHLRQPLSTPQLLKAFAADDARKLESLGGIQEVAPGQQWEMTEKLAAGSYALIDFGQNGAKPNYAKGLFKRFQIADGHAGGTAPATVGEIAMRDYRFAFRLPRAFAGKGVLEIPNRGKTSHEVTLVRVTGGHTPQQVLGLILAGASKPPQWATIIELLSVLDPGKTAYVNVDLAPGRYVALCLMDVPGSRKLQAQLGMIGSFTVT